MISTGRRRAVLQIRRCSLNSRSLHGILCDLTTVATTTYGLVEPGHIRVPDDRRMRDKRQETNVRSECRRGRHRRVASFRTAYKAKRFDPGLSAHTINL